MLSGFLLQMLFQSAYTDTLTNVLIFLWDLGSWVVTASITKFVAKTPLLDIKKNYVFFSASNTNCDSFNIQ